MFVELKSCLQERVLLRLVNSEQAYTYQQPTSYIEVSHASKRDGVRSTQADIEVNNKQANEHVYLRIKY